MGSKLDAIRRMSWRERRLLAEVWIVLTTVALLVRVVGVRRTHAVLSWGAGGIELADGPRGAAARDRVVEAARVVAMASRHAVLKLTCLHRSLTLWWSLRRRGFDVALQLGVRRQDDGFEAHAWVEHGGEVVNDPEVSTGGYTPLSLTPIGRDS